MFGFHSISENPISALGAANAPIFVDASASASGSSAPIAVGAAIADSVANALGAASVSAEGAASADSAASSSGVGAAAAIGEATADSAASSAGVSIPLAIGAATAESAALSSGASTAEAEGVEVLPPPAVPDYSPAGGGGAIEPPGYPGKRFRIRQDKSKPKVYTVRYGEWPDDGDPRLIEIKESQELSEFIAGIPQQNTDQEHGDDDDEILELILSLAA